MARDGKDRVVSCRITADQYLVLKHKAEEMGMMPAQLHSQMLSFNLQLLRSEHKTDESLAFFYARVMGLKR